MTLSIIAVAAALSLPISGNYGTDLSCAGDETDILVSPIGINSLDLSCTPAKVRGTHATLSCETEGDATTMQATVIEDRAAGTLSYSDEFGNRAILHRCP